MKNVILNGMRHFIKGIILLVTAVVVGVAAIAAILEWLPSNGFTIVLLMIFFMGMFLGVAFAIPEINHGIIRIRYERKERKQQNTKQKNAHETNYH